MISDRNRDANRRNAQKSTGPRTNDGKMRSRQNALTHGLTGSGAVIAPVDWPDLEVRRQELAARLQPRDLIEEEYVERMALASVRMRRCVRVDMARLARLEKEAGQPGEGAMSLADRIEELRHGYNIEPLHEVPEGVEWLLGEWAKLLDMLINSPQQWFLLPMQQAIRLVGVCPHLPKDEDERVLRLRKYTTVITADYFLKDCHKTLAELQPGTTRYLELERTIHNYVQSQGGLTVPDAIAFLRDFVQEQIDDLTRRLEELKQPVEIAPDTCAAVEALVDVSAEGARLHRYENMNELAYHRNYNAFMRHRRNCEKLLIDPEVDDTDSPGAQNEPNGSAQVVGGEGSNCDIGERVRAFKTQFVETQSAVQAKLTAPIASAGTKKESQPPPDAG